MNRLQGEITTNEIEKVTIDNIEKVEKVDLSVIPTEHRTRFFNPGELDTLAHLLKSKNVKTMVEIGCQNGRTAKALLNHLPDLEMYVGIDVPPNHITTCDVQKTEVPKTAGELALDDPRFVLLVNKDGSQSSRIYAMLPTVDAVFIDGDHSKDAVLRDHGVAQDITIAGGIIIHHDYHNLGTVGVKEALEEIDEFNNHPANKFKHVTGTWLVYLDV